MIEIQQIEENMLGVIATKSITPETLIRVFDPQYSGDRSKHSIQIGSLHMMDDIGMYLNHHCKPNSEIKDNKGIPCLYATRDI